MPRMQEESNTILPRPDQTERSYRLDCLTNAVSVIVSRAIVWNVRARNVVFDDGMNLKRFWVLRNGLDCS